MYNDPPSTSSEKPPADVLSFGNFRDFGGMASGHGGRIVTGRLYRSGHFFGVDPGLLNRLHAMDFQVIADLRYEGERHQEPSTWPTAWADRVLELEDTPESDAPHVAVMRSGAFDEPAVERFYVHFYEDIVASDAYRRVLQRFFGRLLDADGRVLVHCTAGKDRTGVLVAVIQHLLGVRRDDILSDFMRSNQADGIAALAESVRRRLEQKLEKPVSTSIALKMLQVEAVYLTAALARIDQRYGSVEGYLESLGVDGAQQQRLRARLLDRPT